MAKRRQQVRRNIEDFKNVMRNIIRLSSKEGEEIRSILFKHRSFEGEKHLKLKNEYIKAIISAGITAKIILEYPDDELYSFRQDISRILNEFNLSHITENSKNLSECLKTLKASVFDLRELQNSMTPIKSKY